MPRFLLVTPIYTASSLTGGGQRTLHLFRALSRFGQVDLLLVSEDVFGHLEQDLPSFRAAFTGVGDIIVHRSTEQFLWSPSASAGTFGHDCFILSGGCTTRSARRRASTLRARLPSRPFARFLNRGTTMRFSVATCKPAALSGALAQNRIPVLVDLDDLDEAVIGSRVAAPTTSRLHRLALQLRLIQLVPLVRRLRTRCSHVFTATEEDRVAVRPSPQFGSTEHSLSTNALCTPAARS